MNRNQSKYFNTALKMNTALITLLEKKDFEYKAKLYLDSNNEIKFHFEKK